MKQNIGIVFGGKSNEYEVSIHSAANVIKAIDDEKYQVFAIGITRIGEWFLSDANSDEIASDKWQKPSSRRCFISPNPRDAGIMVLDQASQLESIHIDCFIPVLHGKHGEDGDIQGLFNLCEVPYVGASVLGSAICMDKSIAKLLVEGINVRQARYVMIEKYEWTTRGGEKISTLSKTLGDFPYFIKPASSGSSVGVTKAHNEKELRDGIKTAFEVDNKVLVEEAINGREIEVAVLGNLEPKASRVGEIKSAAEFYDYDSKYINETLQTSIVEDLPETEISKIRATAIEIYRRLCCQGLARVDMFYDEFAEADSRIVFNEVNTLPGFTDISMYPMLWENEGLETKQLITKLIEFAQEQ